MLWAQVNVIWTGFYRQDYWPGICSYYCSLWLCCLTLPSSMTFIAFCHQDGVLCAQSMCLNSMEYLVNFWSRLTSACLSQDCQLFLQTSVIDSRGMDKGTLHSEGFKLCVVYWVFWYLYLIHCCCWICVDLKYFVMHRYISPFKIFAEPLLVYRTET